MSPRATSASAGRAQALRRTVMRQLSYTGRICVTGLVPEEVSHLWLGLPTPSGSLVLVDTPTPGWIPVRVRTTTGARRELVCTRAARPRLVAVGLASRGTKSSRPVLVEVEVDERGSRRCTLRLLPAQVVRAWR